MRGRTGIQHGREEAPQSGVTCPGYQGSRDVGLEHGHRAAPGRPLGPHHAHPAPRRRHRLRDNRSAGGALLVTTVIRTCGIAREPDCSADGKPHDRVTLSPERDRQTKKRYPWMMQGFLHLMGKLPGCVKRLVIRAGVWRRIAPPGCGVAVPACPAGWRRSSSRSSRPGTWIRRSAGSSFPRRSARAPAVPGW